MSLWLEMFKLDINQRFCHLFCNHILSWSVFDLDFIPVNQVGNVEELNMEVMYTLSSTHFSILFQLHRAGIASIDNVGFDFSKPWA
jgi:hypothetical protein